MQLIIDPRGGCRCLYTDKFALRELGSMRIERASHVEPDEQGDWLVDLGPVEGPRLGPFPLRREALAAEVAWLEAHRLTINSRS
ncbi:MAG: hypothetical protein RH917_00455 [Lacipirellulaceae bacterium]